MTVEHSAAEAAPRDSLACGAQSLACFSYVDPNSAERGGVKLFCQACLCPAAVLAANESLIAGEDIKLNPHRVPCADGYAIGSKGLEVYSRTCSSQLMCGFLCMGLPVLYTENLIQRQRIREKYQLPPPSSLSEIGAGCCYPCSLFQSHTFLYLTEHHQKEQADHHRADTQGPLKIAMEVRKKAAASSTRSQELSTNQLQPSRVEPATPPPPVQQHQQAQQQRDAVVFGSPAGPALPDPVVRSPTKTTDVAGRQAEVPFAGEAASSAAHDSLGVDGSLEAGSAGGAAEHVCEGSLGGALDHTVKVLVPPGQVMPRRRPATSTPSVGGSSTDSGHRPGSIPPPEVTDSPRMGGAPAPADSYSASSTSHSHRDNSLGSSTSFLPPAALPVEPTTIRQPPTFPVPPAFKPPDSTDPEMLAEWAQGVKLGHLSRTREQDETAVTSTPQQCPPSPQLIHRPGPATPVPLPAVSAGSDSLFSLDPSASHMSSLPHRDHNSAAGPAVSTGRAPPPAPAVIPPVISSTTLPGALLSPLSPTPGSSIHAGAYDTITSSKLSAMINHAILSGSGGSGPRGSGGTAGTGGVGSSADPAGLPWDSYRHSSMEPIAEGEGEGPGCSNMLPVPAPNPDRPNTAGGNVVATGNNARKELSGSGVVVVGGSSASPCQRLVPSNASRNAARGLRGSGVSGGGAGGVGHSSRGALTGSGGRPSGGSVASGGVVPAAVVAGAGGAALTALARMGGDCGGSGGIRSKNGSGRNHAGPGSQHRSPGPALSAASGANSGVTAHIPARSGLASRDSSRHRHLGASAGSAASAVETSDDNFSGLLQQERQQQQDAATPVQPAAQAPLMTAPHHGVSKAPVCGAYSAADGDDDVNFASIRPSFIDGPEMNGLKEALRRAGGEGQNDALAVAVTPSPQPAPSFTSAAMSSASAAPVTAAASQQQQLSQKIMTLAPTISSLPGNGSLRSRYGAPAAPPLSAIFPTVGASTTPTSAVAAAPAPNVSYYAEGHSQDDQTTHGDSLEDDASSAIDGPVSSGEGGNTCVTSCPRVVLPATTETGRRHPSTNPCSSTCSGTAAYRADDGTTGDASVAVVAVPPAAAVATSTTSKTGIVTEAQEQLTAATASASHAGPGAAVAAAAPQPVLSGAEPAESSAFTFGRRSASGLSNGESNAEYGGDSVADSAISVSQQRQQKHWVNWMAQSVASVGMSVTASSRNLRGTGAAAAAAGGATSGRPGAAWRGSRMVAGGTAAEPGASSVSVNQRMPYPVAEEADEVSYGRWE